MHYKNKRPAKTGDWVVGPTHNSKDGIRVGYVKELMPLNGECNIRLHVWTHLPSDWAGGFQPGVSLYQTLGGDDYAFASNLLHIQDGYRLANIIAEAWNWDDPRNPAPQLQ